jgi:large subunit ribosomal protein L25
MKLRKEGKLPAIVYGKREGATPIALDLKEFEKALREAGESTLITLQGLEGGPKQVLIHDVDIEPVREVPRHADLYVIEKGQKVQVHVPINFIGNAAAERELGGILVKVLHEIEVEAEPVNLPHAIDADVSDLAAFDSQLLAKELKLPPGVVLVTNPEEVVALVQEPKEEVEEETAAPIDMSQIEVEKKGKKEEEEIPEE